MTNSLGPKICSFEITPREIYLSRRHFMGGAGNRCRLGCVNSFECGITHISFIFAKCFSKAIRRSDGSHARDDL